MTVIFLEFHYVKWCDQSICILGLYTVFIYSIYMEHNHLNQYTLLKENKKRGRREI